METNANIFAKVTSPKNLRLLHFSKLSHEIFKVDVESCEGLIDRAEFLSQAFKEIWRSKSGYRYIKVIKYIPALKLKKNLHLNIF